MHKHLILFINTLATLLILIATAYLTLPVSAEKICKGKKGVECLKEGQGATGLETSGQTDLNATVTTVINVILWVVGVISVGFIIYGGVKYAMSSGDSSKVKSAKDTLMYAVIGLIVSLLAYAIVNFVIGSFSKEESSTPAPTPIPPSMPIPTPD